MDKINIGETRPTFNFETAGTTETAGENRRGRKPRQTPIDTNTATAGESNPAPGRETEKVSISTIDGYSINIPAPAPVEEKKARKKRTGSNGIDKTTETNVKLLTMTAFGFASKLTKAGELWDISEEEASTISEPLTRIIQRMGVNETMNKYADYINLSAALAIITIPRLMIYLELKKGEAKNGREKTTNQNLDNGTTKSNQTESTALHTDNIKSILDLNL